MRNIMTVDVEDYYHVSGLQSVIPREQWHRYPQRVVGNTRKLLDIFEFYDVKATFFVLGMVAEQHPGLVVTIQQAGHEIASHGYSHELVYRQTRSQFRKDLRQSKDILEGITRQPILGYRAPSFSIVRDTWWALEILSDSGVRYDSSIYPIEHDRYGIPDARRYPHVVLRKGHHALWEFPPPTYRILGRNIPIAGGGYFRFFPYCFTRACIRALNRQGMSVMVYLHPWEFDPDQPRFRPELKNRIRHYVNLDKTMARLKSLLCDFTFTSISDTCARTMIFREKPHVIDTI